MATENITVESVLNLSEAMVNLDGDVELLQEIMEMFLESADDQILEIQNNMAAGEVKEVAIQAHGMKGGASNFCAKAFVRAALKLEVLAKKGELDGGPQLLEGMKETLAELREVAQVINWQEVERNWQG